MCDDVLLQEDMLEEMLSGLGLKIGRRECRERFGKIGLELKTEELFLSNELFR